MLLLLLLLLLMDIDVLVFDRTILNFVALFMVCLQWDDDDDDGEVAVAACAADGVIGEDGHMFLCVCVY